ncbi:MAG: glycosyltransferase [Verrucomicrobiota bacterium]|nr:glycosyltransferase [Verrucomicrobiota bacterium]
MKILQLVQNLDLRTGGVARAVLLMSEALVRLGNEVEIAMLGAPGASSSKLPTHSLGEGREGYGYSSKLIPWLREHGGAFDRVIVNGLWQYHSLAAWRRFAGSDTPYFVFPHGMLDPWFKRTYPLKHLKKWLYWPWAEYRVLRDARAVIFTSEEERRQARQSFWLYRCRETISPLGVEVPSDSSADEFLTRFPEVRGKQIVLFLGRLHVKKGCDLLIDAFTKFAPNESTLVMAGPDQWNGELQRRAGRNVLFTGMLEGSLKWSAFRAAEVFALPSHQENFALAVAEALACHLPVLISNRVNIWREVLEDGAGFVEDDNAAGVERLARRWFATSPEERAAMRQRAGDCFRKRFEIDHAARLLLKILA